MAGEERARYDDGRDRGADGGRALEADDEHPAEPSASVDPTAADPAAPLLGDHLEAGTRDPGGAGVPPALSRLRDLPVPEDPGDPAVSAEDLQAHPFGLPVLSEVPQLAMLLGDLRKVDRLLADAIDAIMLLEDTGLAEASTGVGIDTWLSIVGRRTAADTRMLRTTATIMRRLPTLHEAFRSGTVSWAQVRSVVLAVRPLPGLGGEVLVMRRAEIVERGPVDRMLSTPAHAYTRALSAAEPRHWDEPWKRDASSTPDDGEALVVAEDIGKRYGARTLFEGLSLTLRAKQRVAIIRTMLVRPRLLFADEPTSRLDLVSQQQTVWAMMSHVAASDCALLLVTHDASLATAVTDRQVVLAADQASSGIRTGGASRSAITRCCSTALGSCTPPTGSTARWASRRSSPTPKARSRQSCATTGCSWRCLSKCNR